MLHLLMLVFFLGADVDSTCSVYNIMLNLVPPEVIEEYGREVSVSCTSDNELRGGMYWKHGSRKSNLTEHETSWTLSLSDWNATTECILKLNESFECSEDLKITLYKNPDMVALYPTMYVNDIVEGTLYDLQCDVVHVAPVQNLTVRWYKDNQVVSTESFPSNTIRTPVNKSSAFTFNISRGDDGARFRCEAQLDFGPHGSIPPPVLSEAHVISVHYAPELNGTADEDVHVVEGDDVTLACDAKGNPPPHFRWTRDGVNITENKSHVNVRQVNTNVTYVCTATNHVGTTTKRIHVYVREDVMEVPAVATTPPVPRIVCPLTVTPDKVVVRFGDPLSIDCTTSARVYQMSWSDQYGHLRFHTPPTATWKLKKVEDWNIKPQCNVTLTNRYRCSAMPAITVYKTPDTVSVSVPGDGTMVEDTEHLLTCDVINVAPLHNLTVTWYRGNTTVSTEIFRYNQTTPVNESSHLRVTPVRDDDGAQYRCSAELHLGQETVPPTYSEPYTAVVHYKPTMHHCPARFSGLERNFSLDTLQCKAKGNPPPTVHWYHRGKRVNTSEPLTRYHSGTYTAELINSIFRSNTSVDITVEWGPLFTCDSHYEVKENDKVQGMCDPDGVPTPTIRWFKDGNETVPPQRWTKHDSGRYVLKAENQHGTANHTLSVDVLYKPTMHHCPARFSGLERNFSLDTLQCKAKGNPPPTVHWYHRGKRVNTSEPLTRYHSGTYTAELINSIFRSNTSVDITVEWGPLFTCDSHYEVKENDKVQGMCDPDGVPTPTIRWFKDGNETVPPQRWTKHDSGRYVLKAENQHGTANHTLSVDVLFAPEIKEANISMELTPGENVTFDCHAEGKPDPKVLWNYTSAANVMQTTRGRRGSIRVTVATSTNAGVYICVATNEVGTVTRSVTLLLKGQAGGRLSFILWPLLVFFIILFFIVLFMLCRCWKKHGQYSFISDKDIPLTQCEGSKV